MELIGYLDLFLGAFLNVIFGLYIVKFIFGLKSKNSNIIKITFIILLTICVTIINIYNKNIFKGLFVMPLFAICVNKIFDIKLSKSLYCTIVSTFYLLIGELFGVLMLSLLDIKLELLISNYLGNTIGNIIVIISTFPFLYVKALTSVFTKLFNYKINDKTILIVFLIFLLIGSAFVFKSSNNVENTVSLIMNIIIFVVFIILLYVSYIETQKVNKISDEYNSLFIYLDKYEKQLNEKRKLIHDFKNQLIVINSYAEDNTKLKEYLKELIEEHKNIKETKILKNINKLPKGLKGLVYYKLSQVDDKNKINLNVNSKYKGFDNLNVKDNRNILKIVGILIDNAIESSAKTKDKYILIDILMNKEIFEMIMINSCEDNFEKTKIMELGFSTKGKNRGYGLSLVKDIIRSDDRYKLDLNMENGEFKTYFCMKMK